MTEPAKYRYDRNYQLKVLATLLRDSGFTRQYRALLRPEYFDYQLMGVAARVALDIWDAYQILPSEATTVQRASELVANQPGDSRLKENLLAVIGEAYRVDLTDARAVIDDVVTFGKVQGIKGSILRAVEILKNDGQVEEVERILLRAASLGNGHDTDLGIQFAKNVADLPYIMQHDKNSGMLSKIPMPSFPTLQSCLSGGPGRGQVFGVLGYPGVGKSFLLRSIACDALWYGFPVVHYTIADLHAEEVAMLYASALTQCTTEQIVNNDPKFQQSALALQQQRHYLRIKEFATSVTVESLRSHLSEVRAVDRVNPAVIIVDYPDKLKAALPREDRWTNEVHNIDVLVEIAREFNCVVWWAWHPTKGAAIEKVKGKDQNKSVLTMADAKGAFEKSHGVDGVISLNISDEEREIQKGRIWIDKLRRGRMLSRPFTVTTNFPYSRIYEPQGGSLG